MIEEALHLYIDEMRLTLVGGDGGAREERRGGSQGGRREGHRDGGDGRDGSTSGGLFNGIGMKGVRQVLTLALFDFGQVRVSFVFN